MSIARNRTACRMIAIVCIAIMTAGCLTTKPDEMLLVEEDGAAAVSVPAPDRALQLLDDGRAGEAENVLAEFLADHPKHAAAKNLMAQIRDDPKSLLGDKFQSYKVAKGDTMSELARRFAGDPTLFYALTRHNGLKSPKQLSAGALIEVPAMAEAVGEAAPSPVVEVTPAAFKAPTAVSEKDKSRAADLRRMGLKKLNGGDVGEAVEFLRKAQGLDPADAAIASDLARAERIFLTVKTRGN